MRLRLLAGLAAGGLLSITQLTALTAVSRQAVTRHLEVLAEAGLVRDQWQGRERLWRVEPAPLQDARVWLERLGQAWDDALQRLRQAVERDVTNAPTDTAP